MNKHNEKSQSTFNPSYVGGRPDICQLIPDSVQSILDIGCSNGTLGHQLKQRFPEAEVFGIDFDAAMVSEARNRLDNAWQKDLNTLHDTAFLGTYDCIIFADVLEHLLEPKQLLKQLVSHHLSETGVIVISVPNASHVTVLYSLLSKRWPERDRGIFDRTHLRWFCKKNLFGIAEELDMAIVQLERNYRLFDKPGGRINAWTRRLGRFLFPFRDYFAYQFVVRLERH